MQEYLSTPHFPEADETPGVTAGLTDTWCHGRINRNLSCKKFLTESKSNSEIFKKSISSRYFLRAVEGRSEVDLSNMTTVLIF